MTDKRITIVDQERGLARAGQVANGHAARSAFADYHSRKAANTLRHQRADLATFAEFLNRAGVEPSVAPDELYEDAEAWRGVTWGLVQAFRDWMVQRGDAIGTINLRLSTIKTYAKLAVKAGALAIEDLAAIRLVDGYPRKEAKRIDEARPVTRRGDKKAAPVRISRKQARRLRRQPDTPQGRRDALLMCLLLNHGLRVGEVVRLQVGAFDLKAGKLTFYRPKVDKIQTIELNPDTLSALRAWFDSGDAPMMATEPILRNSRKGGELTTAGMKERAVTARVKALGERVGLEGLSAHDCRHYWATSMAEQGVAEFRLQEAGGWSSLAMPRRYVADAKIANEGMAGLPI